MKCFYYTFLVKYGQGAGFVFEDTKEDAILLINEEEVDKFTPTLEHFTIEEIDTTKKSIYSCTVME